MFSYDWNFSRLLPYMDAFVDGLGFTVALSLATIIYATLIGIGWGIALYYSRNVRLFTTPLLDGLKGLPPLVVILFGYYFLSQDVVGYSVPAFWAFVISLGLNLAAFIADLTRASISNTPKDMIEMASAFGMDNQSIMRRVIAPIASRELITPLSYLYIETIKLTSLASVIAVRETVYVAQTIITDTSRSLEVWVIVGLVYLTLIIPATISTRWLERHLKSGVGLNSVA